MIDWIGLIKSTFWILGLAIAFAAFSYADWWRSQNRVRLRKALGLPLFLWPFSLGMTSFSLGLALIGRRWWEVATWAVLTLLFAWQTIGYWHAGRRSGWDQSLGQTTETEDDDATT